MTDDTEDTGDVSGGDSGTSAEDVIERGLGAYTAGDILTDLLDSLDVQALADGATFEEAVEYEGFGEALGRLIGHAAAKGTSSSGLLGRVIKGKVVSEVGGKAGKAAGAAFVEHGDPDALLEYLRLATSIEGLDRISAKLDAATDTTTDPTATHDTATEDMATHDASGMSPPTGEEWTEIEIEDADEN